MYPRKFLTAASAAVLSLGIASALIPSATAATTVTSTAQLQAALNAGEDVTLGSSFEVNQSVTVPAAYRGTIAGTQTLTSAVNVQDMFVMTAGAEVTFDGVTLDAAKHGRLLMAASGGKVTFDHATVKNGKASAAYYDGGAVYLAYGTLIANDSSFINNESLPDASPRPGGNGGAIFVTGGNARVELNRSNFSGNHTAATALPGYTGGAIHAQDHATIIDHGSSWNISRTFNTGGAVRLLNATGNFSGSTFTIAGQGDAYGISGGAIASENSTLTVSDSRLSVAPGNKVTHAGGVIDIVGTGKFDLLNSTLTGPGGATTATFGGAIAFETGSSAVATIVDSEIEGFAADQNGGAVTVSTRVGESSSVRLAISGTTITQSSTWRNSNASTAYKFSGGSLMVGPGNSVTIDDNSLIQGGKSDRGGLIFNQGEVLVTGGTKLTDGLATRLGGAIFNAGKLTIDDAVLESNSVTSGTYPGVASQYAGTNVYAAKDVTITPKASLDDGDVRVIDKNSAVILTGKLVNRLNVSVSESEKVGAYQDEPATRYIGYTVARGDGTYEPQASDAQTIHYLSRDTTQLVAAWEDHTGLAMWDAVLSSSNTVVLGQRGVMNFDANQGAFADGTTELAQVYPFYTSERPVSDPLQATTQVPVRDGFEFRGWFDKAYTSEEILAGDAVAFDFSQKFGEATARATGTGASGTLATPRVEEIAKPNTFTAYAGWVRVPDPVDPPTPVDPTPVPDPTPVDPTPVDPTPVLTRPTVKPVPTVAPTTQPKQRVVKTLAWTGSQSFVLIGASAALILGGAVILRRKAKMD